MERELTKNFIFRWFECGLSKEETANLCFVSVRQVTYWDKGTEIPPVYKRLMRMASGRELPTIFKAWEGWRMANDCLISPTGVRFDRRRIEALAIIQVERSERQKEAFYWRKKLGIG
ncbi:DUF3653 domain-containing protein [Aeromonas dhakensis]|uniref:DUF3653 domain-containing protein n=2 Tax=Aeromonas dhakensis TaxID=196024 RepID=UPI000BAABC91|nr:regulator [Aeromonas dhakensis]HDZ8925826.1 regulator [Aeromonas dhakensis]